MPESDAIPDELLLAAVCRAQLHREREAGVPIWQVAEHLGLTHSAHTTRRLRPQLEALNTAGLAERGRHKSIVVWAITRTGRRAASGGQLPEAPQHRAWREARTLAEQEIERFRAGMIDTITDAMEGVERESQSDVLLEIAERLHFECRRLASATYCLREWAEPDDRRADLALPSVASLRNTTRWPL